MEPAELSDAALMMIVLLDVREKADRILWILGDDEEEEAEDDA